MMRSSVFIDFFCFAYETSTKLDRFLTQLRLTRLQLISFYQSIHFFNDLICHKENNDFFSRQNFFHFKIFAILKAARIVRLLVIVRELRDDETIRSIFELSIVKFICDFLFIVMIFIRVCFTQALSIFFCIMIWVRIFSRVVNILSMFKILFLSFDFNWIKKIWVLCIFWNSNRWLFKFFRKILKINIFWSNFCLISSQRSYVINRRLVEFVIKFKRNCLNSS